MGADAGVLRAARGHAALAARDAAGGVCGTLARPTLLDEVLCDAERDEAAARHLFGTDGIRGVANEHPMTPELALRLGRAITFVAGRGKTHAPRILIGKDTRLSGYMLETALAAGICAMGGEVHAVRADPDAGGRAPHAAACARTRAS